MNSQRGINRHIHQRLALIVGLLSMAMLRPSPAHGQTAANADELYAQGIALRAAGKHEKALDRFRSSMLIEHRPSTYLALASSLNELGKPDEAIAALDAMFIEFDATMKPQTRERADRALLVLEAKLGFGQLAITAQEKGIVLVDTAAVGTLPLPRALRLREGAHAVRIERDGAEPFLRDVIVTKGSKLILEVPPLPIARVIASEVLPISRIVEPLRLPNPTVMPIFVVPKPVVMAKSPFQWGVHAAFLAGIGTSEKVATLPPTTCGMYCLPALSLLAGVHADVPMIRWPLRIEFGAEYLHAASTLNVAWQRNGVPFAEGVTDATFDFKHSFALDGGLVYAAIGANLALDKRVRIEGRAGFGVFLGQSVETVSGRVEPQQTSMQQTITSLDIAEVNERTALIVLPVLRSRLGVSVGIGPFWLGIGVQSVVSAIRGPDMCTPQVTIHQIKLEASDASRSVDDGVCPDGIRSARPFERLLLVAPEVSISRNF